MTNFCVKSVTLLDNHDEKITQSMIKALEGSYTAPFQDCLSFCVDFECDTDLQHHVVWKVLYMNEDEADDQELHTESMPVRKGTFSLTLKSPPPDLVRIPTPDVIGACVIKLTCTYEDMQFFGVGYFCNVTCSNEALTCETITDDTRPDVSTLTRDIMLGESRETRAPCHFDSPPPAPEAEAEAEGDDTEGAGGPEEEASDHSSLMDEEEDEEDEASDIEI